jgi:hypothetical protein
MGVLPMVMSGDLMWMPLGTVIFFGTLISMLFVVTVLPVAYCIIFKKSDKIKSDETLFSKQILDIQGND